MKRYLAFFLCLALTAFAMAQSDTVRIEGRVTDSAGEPLEACIVAVLEPQDSAIVAYAMTDEHGAYGVLFTTRQDEVLLRLTGFNVKRQMQRVKATSRSVDFRAEEESMALREVQIKAQKLWGSRDTLNYLVAAYTKEQDRTIGDVLKQLPGITIDEGGTIKYQGTPINHFYIENLDVLQGRYNLATNGIRAEDVATVQVLENHEHVKALQDQVPPESAAINLKLKKKAKGVWTKNLDLTLGADENGPLWNCGADVMYFGGGRQHFLHYGNDNTGRGSVALRHYGGGGIDAPTMVDVLTPSTPVLKINTHSISLNNLNKLSETKQLHYNLGYSFDRELRESYARTTWFLPDGGTTVMVEDIAARHTTNDADLQLTYEDNAEKRFLNNSLTLNGSWNEGKGDVMSNDARVGQCSSVRILGMSNSTRWVHRTDGGGGFELNTTNSFSSSPQSLIVVGDMAASQNVKITQASTNNRIEMLRNLRRHKWTLTPALSLKGEGVFLSALNSEYGNSGMDYYRGMMDVGAVTRYVNGDFRFTLRTPISFYYTRVANNGNDKSPSLLRERAGVRVSPSYSLLWKANDHFTFNAGGGYSAGETPWTQLITNYIMSNYRTMNRYVADLSDSHRAMTYGKVNYKDIFTSFFAYLEASATRDWSDVIYGTTIGSDGHTVMQAERMPHHSQNYQATLNLRKDFDWHRIQIEAAPRWNRNESRQLRQGQAVDYSSVGLSLHTRVALDIVQGQRLEYNCDWNRSRSTVNTMRSYSQSATLSLSLVPKTLFFNITGKHTHNSYVPGKKDYTFLDANLKLKYKKIDWRLDCTNILNTHRCVTRTTTDMTEYYTEYNLRPRAFLLSAAFNL